MDGSYGSILSIHLNVLGYSEYSEMGGGKKTLSTAISCVANSNSCSWGSIQGGIKRVLLT